MSMPQTEYDIWKWDWFLNEVGPPSIYSYSGGIALWRASPSDWRRFRMRRARFLGTHTKEEWINLRDSIGRCAHCGADDVRLVKDHIAPIVQGGCDCIHNLQPLCDFCNSRKCGRMETAA